MTNAIMNYDFTLNANEITSDELQELLKEWCREWVFQTEKGDKTGYIHYQGRMKMKVKIRGGTLFNKLNLQTLYLSPTSNNNIKNDFYVTKEDTRIDGPWRSEDKENPIPWDIKMITELKPWQKSMKELCEQRNLRNIYIILDEYGNTGKTTFARWMAIYGHAKSIPHANEHRDICRMVMDMPISKTYIFDMPRSLRKDKLQSLYAGIEMVKGGYAYDDRYEFKDRYFDPPNIIVFTNKEPDHEMLSLDRWVFFTIHEENLMKRNQALKL